MKAKIRTKHAGAPGGSAHEFKHGNTGMRTRPAIADSRHHPHPRGGDHHARHGRDGNPKG